MHKKKKMIGIGLMLIGLVLSILIYKIKNIVTPFKESDVFWIIGMPLICVGLIFFISRKQQDLHMGKVGKVFLLVLLLVWLVMIYFLVF